MSSVTINGNTYSDDGSEVKDMLNGGHRAHFLPMVGDVATVAGVVASQSAQATIDAATAAAAAAALTGTSATSTTVGTGSKVFTTQAGKQFTAGSYVVVSRTSAPTTLMFGTVTAYASTTLTVDVELTNGSGTFADWKIAISGARGATGSAGVPAPFVASARTSNTILGVADSGALIDITSGTFTQTFTAAATLGSGWWCYVRNRGTGTVTLDPNASELIDGATTLPLAIGDVYLVQCDGSAFNAVLVDRQTFSWDRYFATSTNAATFTVPSGVYAIRAYLFGAGGNGVAAATAAGGGGGSCGYGTIPTVPGTVFTFGISGTDVTLKVGATLYLDANSGANGSAGTGGAGGVAGTNGAGLGIFDSGSYAGGAGGSCTTTGMAGGGASGSPLGAGGAGGAVGFALSASGGGGWAGAGGATSAAVGGGGGGAGYAGGEGGSFSHGSGGGSGSAATAGVAASSEAGLGRVPTNYYTDPLLKDCISPGRRQGLTVSPEAGPGGGGAGGTYGGGGGFGAGGGGGTNNGPAFPNGPGGFGGGGGGNSTATTSVGGRGGVGGGGGGGRTTAGTGGAAAVIIFY